MTFQDHFSANAADYARFRPRSPEPLFDWLREIVTGHQRAWDAGTGNGQAAIPLAERFSEVIATDPSAEQLLRVPPNPKIRTLVAAEECAEIESASVDLVTVAQAAHWFDLDRFGAEVDRVCRPGAVVALWSYGLFRVEAEIDRMVRRFYRDVVGQYWPPERRLVDEEYRTLPFRWPEIEAPRFAIENSLTLEGVLAYVHTWSAVQRFIGERGFDPVPELGSELREAWTGALPVRFELALRVGRVGRSGEPVQEKLDVSQLALRLFKYQALGNDYLVVEKDVWAPWDRPAVTRALCDRRFGLGADGVLVRSTATAGDRAVETVRILNADGSEAEKSGNGLRIFARYLFDTGRVGEGWFAVRTLAGEVRCQVAARGASVSVVMGTVSFAPLRVLELDGEAVEVHGASVGNPHCVVLVPHASEDEIRRLGPRLETHPAFPDRTNVQLLQVVARDRIRLEIWERGSGYTWSSGSCASAGAAVAYRLGLVDEKLQVEMRGGTAKIEIGTDFEVTLLGAVESVATVEPADELLRQL